MNFLSAVTMSRSGHFVVPGGGIEPPRCHQRGILSPVRLPIPPSRQSGSYITV
jgi:hypothetical protein